MYFLLSIDFAIGSPFEETVFIYKTYPVLYVDYGVGLNDSVTINKTHYFPPHVKNISLKVTVTYTSKVIVKSSNYWHILQIVFKIILNLFLALSVTINLDNKSGRLLYNNTTEIKKEIQLKTNIESTEYFTVDIDTTNATSPFQIQMSCNSTKIANLTGPSLFIIY